MNERLKKLLLYVLARLNESSTVRGLMQGVVYVGSYLGWAKADPSKLLDPAFLAGTVAIASALSTALKILLPDDWKKAAEDPKL